MTKQQVKHDYVGEIFLERFDDIIKKVGKHDYS